MSQAPVLRYAVAPVMSERVADCKGRVEVRRSLRSIPCLADADAEFTAHEWATIDSPPQRSPHFRRVRPAVCSHIDAEVGCIGDTGRQVHKTSMRPVEW
jgi:hypothetical protein